MVLRWLAAAAAISPGLACLDPACAQSLHAEADGQRMEIALSCVAEVSVSGNGALHGHAVLDATAAHQEELNQLILLAAPRIRLRQRTGEAGDGTCWHPPGTSSFTPTMKVVVMVPEDFPLSVDAAGSGTYRIAVGGLLSLQLSGSPEVTVESTKTLNLNMSGSARVSIRQVQGPVHVELSGSGEVRFGQIESEAAAVEQSGSTDFSIEKGSIAALSIQNSGSGAITIGGTVTNAVVDTSGSGNVRLARVTGNLVQDNSGSGSVQVLAH